MKIGLAIYGSLETLSGGYLYDRKMVDYLTSAGDHVEIITLPWQNYFLNLSSDFIQRKLDRFYKLDIDILILDELNYPSFDWLNRRTLEKPPYPIVSVVHQLKTTKKASKTLKWVYRQVEKMYLKSIDGFIFNSNFTRHAVQAIIGEKVSGVVAYPSGSRFEIQLPIHQIVQRAHNATLEILFVGDIIPRKGLHILIDSLNLLHNTDWHLTIIGNMNLDTDYLRKIYRRMEENNLSRKVKFLGNITDNELIDIYKKSHVLAVPSVYEGFGIVYLEAMNFGVIPIASKAGGAREIISSGNDGYLIPADRFDVLAEDLQKLISDRELLAAMGIGAYHKFKKYPSWEETGRVIRNYLMEFLHHHP